jgi:hypothetical protein
MERCWGGSSKSPRRASNKWYLEAQGRIDDLNDSLIRNGNVGMQSIQQKGWRSPNALVQQGLQLGRIQGHLAHAKESSQRISIESAVVGMTAGAK